ncbi:MAG: tripartite tricarboxylate transporter substrate binding protein [Alcaligenaceae bacterium]|nr:tripartite tricarboxylate transporter substrate binding protein [Alcaligenaceae bacterium]
MKRLNKSLLLVLLMPLSCLLVSAQAQTQAQMFPNKPLKIVVGFPPGGGSDLMARIVAEKMSVMLKQPVIVDNKPGAGSTIAATFVSRAAPDGYTILFGQAANIGVAPAIMNTLTYDSLKDFAPITRLVSAPLVLVGPADLPAKDLKELIALAAAKPNALSYGSPGSGTVGHLAGAMFMNEAEVKAVHVPYKGQSLLITDMMGGRIAMYFSTIAVVKPYVESGKMRAFGVTSAKPSAAFPGLPAIADAGLPGYAVENWYGLLAPAGTPAAVIDTLQQTVKQILLLPDVQRDLTKEGGEVGGETASEFAQFLAIDIPKWRKIATDAQLTP